MSLCEFTAIERAVTCAGTSLYTNGHWTVCPSKVMNVLVLAIVSDSVPVASDDRKAANVLKGVGGEMVIVCYGVVK